ncbi:pyridoxal phosphate-dependent transferase [Microdochium bolleyi]|uniref:Pyridoxal phosphate-dependent transferase n=1 Tax=Microdochium bolleyi TaxID=196109 RepID=A0A136JEU5_9PEZI|nr:pyridoxal phosphate-dependent transferase [Microdochium bolleyi]
MSTTTMGSEKTPINLHRGWPSTSLLPVEPLKKAAQAALSREAIRTPSSALLYAPDPGLQELREVLAGWLGQFYGAPHSGDDGSTTKTTTKATAAAAVADQITITGGASQSLANVLASFTDPSYTRAVWMVAPAYFLACPIMADAGFGAPTGKMRAVPEDDEGIDLDFLSAGLKRMDQSSHEDDCDRHQQAENSSNSERTGHGQQPLYKDPYPYRKIYRHVIYCVPTFANPSGKTMSLRRRRRLVELAREHDALVVCDDVYDMLQWSTAIDSSEEADLNRAILPRLVDIDLSLGPSEHDRALSVSTSSSGGGTATTINATGGTSPTAAQSKHFGHAISNGSFSKLAGPGLRTGWTQSTADFALGLSQTGATRSGGAPSQFTASIVCELLRSGELQREIESVLRPAFRRRHGLIMRAVEDHLTEPFGVAVGSGRLDGGVFGGYFIWLTLPVGTDKGPFPGARAIAERCKRDEELIVGYGGMFEVQGDEDAVKLDHAIRLCFAWEEEGNLVQGVERMGRAIKRMLEEGPSSWQGVGEGEGNGRGADEQK